MGCDEWRELISAEMDGELEASEAEGLEGHVAKCPSCRKAREDYRLNRLILHAMEPVKAPERAWPALVRELHVLHPGSGLTCPAEARPPLRSRDVAVGRHSRLGTWMGVLKVAACLAVAFVGLLAWLGYTDLDEPEPMAPKVQVVVKVSPRSLIRGHAWLQVDNPTADRSGWHSFVASEAELGPDRGRPGQNEYQIVQEEVR